MFASAYALNYSCDFVPYPLPPIGKVHSGVQTISRLELEGEGYKVLALIEEQKAMPWQAVYDEFCVRNGVPVGADFIADIDRYVAEVTSKR